MANRIAALCLASTLLAGCSTYRQSVRTAQVGGVMVAAGILLGIAASQSSNHDEPLTAGAFAVGGAGGWLTVGGLLGMLGMHREKYAPPPARVAPVAPVDTAEVQRHEHAWELTKRAAAAARIGDCQTVLELGQQLYGFDRDFHDSVFARDIAIRRCVWPEPLPGAPSSGVRR